MGCRCQSPHRNLFMCVVPRCVCVVCVSQALPAPCGYIGSIPTWRYSLGPTMGQALVYCVHAFTYGCWVGCGLPSCWVAMAPWLASVGCWCGRMPTRQQVATVFCGHLASAPVALLSWVPYRLGQNVVWRPEAGLNLSVSAAAAGTIWCPSQWQSLSLGCYYHQYCYCCFTVSGPRLITLACAK